VEYSAASSGSASRGHFEGVLTAADATTPRCYVVAIEKCHVDYAAGAPAEFAAARKNCQSTKPERLSVLPRSCAKRRIAA